VVNLPGSPRGAVESLDAVAELLPHAIEVLRGAKHD
jgi:molybdopterin biosynthesis enzyme MoaB